SPRSLSTTAPTAPSRWPRSAAYRRRATAIYMRVSSTNGQDTRSQEPDLTTWAKAQADDVAWYRDRFTDTFMERPGLEPLLADVCSGKITRVVVWRLDWLGRTARGLLTLWTSFRRSAWASCRCGRAVLGKFPNTRPSHPPALANPGN